MESYKIIKQLYSISLEIITKLKFNKHEPIEAVGVLFYLSIIENIKAIMVLIENQLNSAIEVILRNILEAYIDLYNLSEDINYIKILQITSDIDRKLLKIIKDTPISEKVEQLYKQNGKDSLTNAERKELYEFVIKHYKLRKNKIDNITIYDKFKISQKEVFYKQHYAILCTHSHNNLNALVHRNVIVDESGKYSIQMFIPIKEDDFNFNCDIISFILDDATRSIYKILNIENEDLTRIIALREKFIQLHTR